MNRPYRLACYRRYTHAVYEEHGDFVQGLSKEGDIPIDKEAFEGAFDYICDTACRTRFVKGTVVNSSVFIHGSGVSIFVNERNGNPECGLETITFFSTTNKKIDDLIKRAKLNGRKDD